MQFFFTFFSVGGDCDGPRWRVRTKISFFSRCRFSFSARCEIIGSRKKTRPNTLFGLFRFQAAAAGGQFQNLSVLKLLLEWKFHFLKIPTKFHRATTSFYDCPLRQISTVLHSLFS